MSSLFDDTDDHLSHRTRRAEAAGYAPDSPGLQSPAHDDREVTLNTGIVLALFFALALVCAVFFGFGYSIGHKSGMSAASALNAANTATDSGSASEGEVSTPSKPAPGLPASPAIPAYQPPGAVTRPSEKAIAMTPTPALPRDAATETVTVEPAQVTRPSPIARTPQVTAAVPTTADTATTPAASSALVDGTASSYVQIAAVSHQEDADVLLSALRRRGYRVIQRSEPADRLIHVQIGPFANRKDAEATKQKLLADGYNAFIK